MGKSRIPPQPIAANRKKLSRTPQIGSFAAGVWERFSSINSHNSCKIWGLGEGDFPLAGDVSRDGGGVFSP
jgi:hypothetical protein